MSKNWMASNVRFINSNNINIFHSIHKIQFDEWRYYSPEGFSIEAGNYKNFADNNQSQYQVIIQNHTNPNANINEKYIYFDKDDNLYFGIYVKFDNEYYILIAEPIQKAGVYKKSKIQKCNNVLTFQDENFNTIQTPCIIEDKTSVYSDGVNENKYLSLAENQILVTVPKDEYTEKLELNKRFIFDQSEDYVFKLTKIDGITQPGLLKLTMTKDSVNSNDRLDLNIADYVDVEEQTGIGYEITVQGSDMILLYNTAIYTAKVYLDGVEVAESVEWSLSNENASIVSQDSQSITIKGEVEQSSVILTATLVVDNNITATKEITIGGLF